jgi:putative ABC transport system permease protein
VESASLAATVPLTIDNSAIGMRVNPGDRPVPVTFNIVSAGTWPTLGIRLLDGRDFTPLDTASRPSVAIINERLARQWFGSARAVGQQFIRSGLPGEPATPIEIVGVAANAQYTRIGEPQDFYAYFPIAQMFVPAATLMVRSTGDPASLAPAIRRVVRAIDPALPVADVRTLEAASSISLLPARVAAAVSGMLGVLVLILSTVGLYGAVAFITRQRRREIGIRMSLGATAADVARLFLRQSARWAMTGVGIGVVLALAATRAIQALLFGLSPVDPATFAGAIALMLLVTGIASYLPARRAASLDPVRALQAD